MRPINPPAGSQIDAAALWAAALSAAAQQQSDGRSGLAVAADLAEVMDRLVGMLADNAVREWAQRHPSDATPFAIAAVGGWGRRQLQPHSDVDLLFLHGWQVTPFLESVTESVLYALWDLGFTVGHAVRTAADCVAVGRDDITVRTNLLDMRLVYGDDALWQEASAQISRELLRPGQKEFAEGKIREMTERRARYGGTTYLLEPNIKESPGGLRDLQTVYWIARSAFDVHELGDLWRRSLLDREEAQRLEDAFEALIRMRNWMHLLSGKGTDRLTFDLQEKVAKALGYHDHRTELSSEQCMRDFYERTRGAERSIDLACASFLEHLRGGPGLLGAFRRRIQVGDGFFRYRERLYGSPAAIRRNPHLLLRAFELAQSQRIPLSPELAATLRREAGLLATADPDEHARAARVFLRILEATDGLFETLGDMNDLGVLRTFMPEFQHQYCRIQHDTYHIYTADVHLLFCLKAWTDLRSGRLAEDEPELTEIAQRIADPVATALAVLLHDIGKGYGRDHSEKGAELCDDIGGRLGLDPKRTEQIADLVRQHLLMSHTAQRRDLSDPQVIRNFAREVGDAEALAMLCVLTYCDQAGVGPGVWTPWKRSLILQLHDDTRRVLEREDIQGLHRSRIRSAKARIEKRLRDEADDALLARFLDEMPPRFYLRHNADEAVHVFRVLAEAESAGIGIGHYRLDSGEIFVVISEPDRAGLFAVHAGQFRATDMSIIEAEGYVLDPSGQVINIFLIEPPDPLFFDQSDRVARFRRRILDALAKKPVPQRSPENSAKAAQRPRSRRRVRVRVDQRLSQYYTVIEVFGWDRIGLLQDLAWVLYSHGCSIELARIHTEGQRVSDVFYIERQAGGKLDDTSQIAAIEQDLLAVIRA
jgi:[protein-PII] uridylyltransferase